MISKRISSISLTWEVSMMMVITHAMTREAIRRLRLKKRWSGEKTS
jgi:hypothetical protein